MRKVIVAAFVSLDGVMQAPGGPEEDKTGGFKFGGWVAPHWDETTSSFIEGVFSEPYDLLLGRKTYEIFAAHWPYQEGGEDSEIAVVFNRVRKYVVTSSREPLRWKNSEALHDPVKDIARLKQEDGPNLLIQGSSELIHTLLAHGLLDEVHLMVFPILLGKGKRFFSDDAKPMGLKFQGAKTSASGVTKLSYVPSGEAVPTGSFASDPSKEELARRERWAREG